MNKIEQLAKTIYEENSRIVWEIIAPTHQERLISNVRRLIELLSEPTEKMLEIGAHINSEHLNDRAPIGEEVYRHPAKAVYQGMLSYLLKTGG